MHIAFHFVQGDLMIPTLLASNFGPGLLVIECIRCLVVASPLWVPLVFAGYAIGSKRFGVGFLLTFTMVEAASIALVLSIIDSI